MHTRGEHANSTQKGPSWELNLEPSCCEATVLTTTLLCSSPWKQQLLILNSKNLNETEMNVLTDWLAGWLSEFSVVWCFTNFAQFTTTYEKTEPKSTKCLQLIDNWGKYKYLSIKLWVKYFFYWLMCGSVSSYMVLMCLKGYRVLLISKDAQTCEREGHFTH